MTQCGAEWYARLYWLKPHRCPFIGIMCRSPDNLLGPAWFKLIILVKRISFKSTYNKQHNYVPNAGIQSSRWERVGCNPLHIPIQDRRISDTYFPWIKRRWTKRDQSRERCRSTLGEAWLTWTMLTCRGSSPCRCSSSDHAPHSQPLEYWRKYQNIAHVTNVFLIVTTIGSG